MIDTDSDLFWTTFFYRVGTYVNSGVFGGIRGGQKKVVQNRSESVSIMLDDAP